MVLCRNHDGTLQFSEFKALANRYPMSLFPLYNFQSRLKQATLGDETWNLVRLRVDGAIDLSKATAAAMAKA